MIESRRAFWLLLATAVAAMPLGCAAVPPAIDRGAAVVRGQGLHDEAGRRDDWPTPGSDKHYRHPVPVSGPSSVMPAQRTFPAPPLPAPSGAWPPGSNLAPADAPPNGIGAPERLPPEAPAEPPPYTGPSEVLPPPESGPYLDPGWYPSRSADVRVDVQETETGRFMFGVGVNSDAGLTGNIVIDERNFDITRIPTSFRDFVEGTAFRGGGQGFRMEALPGTELQRYMISFTEPNLLFTDVSLSVSGFFYDRRFFDWDEQRFGGRLGLGYRLSPDLSASASIRTENVTIHDPRVSGVPELDASVGKHDLFSGRFSLAHDTRDIPFSPTEGHLFEVSYEQVFGSFDYPRGDIDIRQYFLVTERPDGSGRHVIGASFRLGITGRDTPIFENYFAGGFSTLRGFDFRGASPKVKGVDVGGEFRFLGSVEYTAPITADDMLRGVLFCDFGTVEEHVELFSDHYRVAPGFGLRIFVPAMGPAPIALDFAFPIAYAETDEIENFQFFIGFGR